MYTKVGLIVAVLAAVGCWVQVFSGVATAETGGYPYADKPCVHAPYRAQGTAANWCADYDFGDRRDDKSAGNVISPYGYYYRNCTDYAAWKLAAAGVGPQQYKGLGHARQWAQPPTGHGLHVDAVPAPGAVGVRAGGTYGHVAYVEEVYADGSIRVSQYNKQATGNYSEAVGTPAALGLTRFVHFEQYMPVAAVAVAADVPAAAVSAEPVPSITVPAESSTAEVAPITQASSKAAEPVPVESAVIAAVIAGAEQSGEAALPLPVEMPSTMLAAAAPAIEASSEPLPIVTPVAPTMPAVALQPLEIMTTGTPPLGTATAPPASSGSGPSLPAEPIRPAPAQLRDAGFATIVVPYQWWQAALPAPPSRLAAIADDTAGQSLMAGYAALAGLLVAGAIPGLGMYARWLWLRVPRFHIVRC